MTIFKAYVHDGRLLLDEAIELPEGEVVYLQQVDRAAVSDGELSADEREDLFQALGEAIESARPPENEDADGEELDAAPHEALVEPESSPVTQQS